jgi:two-component system, OmpR family, response regulator MtrA
VGQFVEFELHLDGGPPLVMRAEVSREGTERRAAGLRYLEPAPQAVEAITGCIDRLMAKQAPSATRPGILVADDDATILEFLNKALTKYGYQVHKARRGEEALALVRELKPALVILDILMPGIDGVDICKTMRADVEMAGIPVIFLSALETDRLHVIADESGATDYLSKPVALADLINLVGQYLKA